MSEETDRMQTDVVKQTAYAAAELLRLAGKLGQCTYDHGREPFCPRSEAIEEGAPICPGCAVHDDMLEAPIDTSPCWLAWAMGDETMPVEAVNAGIADVEHTGEWLCPFCKKPATYVRDDVLKCTCCASTCEFVSDGIVMAWADGRNYELEAAKESAV